MPPPYARLKDPASYVLPRIVRTSRLDLCPASVDDAAAVARAKGESHAELVPWFHGTMGNAGQERDARWQSERLAEAVGAHNDASGCPILHGPGASVSARSI